MLRSNICRFNFDGFYRFFEGVSSFFCLAGESWVGLARLGVACLIHLDELNVALGKFLVGFVDQTVLG